MSIRQERKRRSIMSQKGIRLVSFLAALAATGFYTALFFGRWIGLIPSVLIGFDVYSVLSEYFRKVKQRKRRDEFRGFLRILSSALSAGYSIERALQETEKECGIMYGDESEIVHELTAVNQRISLKETIGKALRIYAEHVELEEGRDFSEVMDILQVRGGNTVQVIEDTIQRVTEGIELQDEVETMIMSKQLELFIMVAMPAAMVLYLRAANASYMAPLLGTRIGFILMSTAIGMNVGAELLGRRIVNGRIQEKRQGTKPENKTGKRKGKRKEKHKEKC